MLGKRIALGFGIAVVFPAMVHFGVSTFVPAPRERDYQVESYYGRHERANPEEQKSLEDEAHATRETEGAGATEI